MVQTSNWTRSSVPAEFRTGGHAREVEILFRRDEHPISRRSLVRAGPSHASRRGPVFSAASLHAAAPFGEHDNVGPASVDEVEN